LISSSLSELANSRATIFNQFSAPWLARAHALCGRIAEAQNIISQALDALHKTDESWDAAEIHRTAGELAVSRAQPDVAEEHFRQSLGIARRQGAKSYELRAATSLARLWRSQSRRGEAVDLLAPVTSWFTEGFELSDLMEAKALLEELR
jgi:predicted ATPase